MCLLYEHSLAQAVRRSSPTAGVPNSLFGHSMWVSWWAKLKLGMFFSRFLSFSPTTNFISHSPHSFLLISLAPVMMRQAWSAGILAIYRPLINGASSHLIPRPGPISDTN